MRRKFVVALIVAISTLFALGIPVFESSASGIEYDDTFVSCYQSDSGLVNPPTIISTLDNATEVDSMLMSVEKPSNLIVNFDENANVLDENGDVIDSFYDLRKSEIGRQTILMAKIESEAAADSFIDMIRNTYRVLDIAVISSQPQLIKKIKSEDVCKHIRGVVEYTEDTDPYEVVKVTNENYAITAVIPQSMATTENIRFIQARFKTVWIRVSDDSGLRLHDCINSGAYGLIVEDYGNAYAVLSSYTEGYTRTPFNVAHRGLPKNYNENSISGMQAAIESGATHVELDAYLTLDKQIVMMHDPTLERTTNGTGYVESKTLEAIRQSKLDLFGEEEIPIADDIFQNLKGKDVVLIFEIKSQNTELVTLLKDKIEQYDFWRQIVVISFYTPILAKMKEVLPQIPTANLNEASMNTFATTLEWMGELNTGIDTGYGYANSVFNETYLRDRGIIGWYWTFETFGEGTASGYVGQTNNQADVAKDLPMYALGLAEESATVTRVAVGDLLKVRFRTYGGETVLECTVTECRSYTDRYEIICACPLPVGLQTRILTIEKEKGKDENTGEENGASCFGSISFAPTFLLPVTIIVFVKKRGKNG